MSNCEKTKESGIQWIGQIPTHWSTYKLKYLGDYINGYAFKPEDWSDNGLPIIRIQDLTKTNNEPNYYSGNLDKKYLVSHQELLVSWAATLDAYLWQGYDGWLNQHIFKVIPRDDVNKEYLYWLLKVAMRELNEDNKHGIMMEHLTLPVFENFIVPLPPLSEQISISNYLDKKVAEVDCLIEKTEKSVELLEEYRKSVITDVVTKGLDSDAPMKDSCIEWIGKIPEGWNPIPLKYLVESVESGRSVDGANYPAEPTGVGVLTLSSVYRAVFDPQANKAVDATSLLGLLKCPVKGNSLLVSRCNTSEWVGTAALVEADHNNLFLPDKIWQLRFPSWDLCRWIWYFLQSNYAREYFAINSVGASTTMQNISKDDLLSLVVLVPSADDMVQGLEELGSRVESIELSEKGLSALKDALAEYRKSLISEAVTGKLKVPGVM